VFEVFVNGQLKFSKKALGRFPTDAEIDALGRTDRRLWTSGAQWIDARLQRCDLGSGGRNVAKPKTPR